MATNEGYHENEKKMLDELGTGKVIDKMLQIR